MQLNLKVTQTSIPYLAALVSVSEEVRARCHLKYNNHFTLNLLNEDGCKKSYISHLTQSPTNTSIFEDININSSSSSIRNNCILSHNSINNHNLNIFASLQQLKRQKSCDFIDSRALILGKNTNFIYILLLNISSLNP